MQSLSQEGTGSIFLFSGKKNIYKILEALSYLQKETSSLHFWKKKMDVWLKPICATFSYPVGKKLRITKYQ